MVTPIPENEAQRLAALHDCNILDTAREDVYDDITCLAAQICGVSVAAISLVDKDRQWFKSILGLEARETSRDVAFCAHTILQTDVLVVSDAREDARFAENPLVTGSPDIRFYAGAPLTTSDGFALGSLCVIDQAPRQITPQQSAGLRLLARQAVTQIELTRRVAAQERLIADRQQAEEALRQIEQRYQRIAANVPGVVYQSILHADGTTSIPFISDACRDVFGLEPSHIRQDASLISSLIHPEDCAAYDQSISQSARSLEPWHWEGRFLLPSGRLVWVQGASRPERLSNGDILWDGLLTDVTTHKLAEEALQVEVAERRWAEVELERVLLQSEQILSSISSILISVDERGEITTWNQAATAAFGPTSGDVLGVRFDLCGIRWDWDMILAGASRCQDRQEPVRIDMVPLQSGDGRERFLGITLNPINRYCDEPKGFLLLAADVTERRILEGQLSHAQKMESIGQLAAGIAHEINTPIQYIGDNTRFLQEAMEELQPLLSAYQTLTTAAEASGAVPAQVAAVGVAEKDADPDYLLDEIPRAIQQSLEGIDRVTHIVRAMKDFSHPGTASKVATDLNRALSSTITVASNEWKYVAEVVTDFDASLPLVPCLPADLNQVFLNMLINASHAISDVVGDGARGKGTIHVKTRWCGDHVEIHIGDTGSGMTEAIRARIFDPFFTTKEVGRGTGQGLAISHAVVVEKHRGCITVESAPGRGSTFIISLPLLEKADPEGNS